MPSGSTLTFRVNGLEVASEVGVTSLSTTVRGTATPLAVTPVVVAVRVQGLNVRTSPTSSPEPGAKLVAVTVKMHDAKVVGPDAVFTPLVMVKVGVAPANEMVVAPVMLPKPAGKLATAAGVVTKAGTVKAVTLAVVFVAATFTGAGSLPPPPPPQAASAATRVMPKASLTNLALFILT